VTIKRGLQGAGLALAMLVAAAVVAAVVQAGAVLANFLPPADDFPRIPRLAVQISTVGANSKGHDLDCRSASATFLMLLLQGKHKPTKALMVS
jgi:hypothetical protein